MRVLHRNRNRCILILSLAVAVLSGAATSAAANLDPELQAITTFEFGDSREPLCVVSDMVTSSAGDESRRSSLERQFAEILTSDATYECKQFVCRKLWVVGTDISIPALSKLLADSTTTDMARYALEENPSSAAGKALRDALGKVTGTARIGIINSLGERGDTEAVAALSKLVFGEDDGEALAAIKALGRIASLDAGKTLGRARHESDAKRSKAATSALLIWSDSYFAQ